MSRKAVLLVGVPDSGKSNYVGRLWISLKNAKGVLQRTSMPTNIAYVESICEHLLQGEFAARTDKNSLRQDFCVSLTVRPEDSPTELVVPDFTGELWYDAVEKSEMPREWLDELENAYGALLFVRVHSKLNVQPCDWVTARDVLSHFNINSMEDGALPMQVVLCELLRLLQDRLAKRPDGERPRVAVMITAWDKLDADAKSAGPAAFLHRQFPMFAGMLDDIDTIDTRIYGVSIVGGDLKDDPEFQKQYENMDMSESGSVMFAQDGTWHTDSDITIPVAWVIED